MANPNTRNDARRTILQVSARASEDFDAFDYSFVLTRVESRDLFERVSAGRHLGCMNRMTTICGTLGDSSNFTAVRLADGKEAGRTYFWESSRSSSGVKFEHCRLRSATRKKARLMPGFLLFCATEYLGNVDPATIFSARPSVAAIVALAQEYLDGWEPGTRLSRYTVWSRVARRIDV